MIRYRTLSRRQLWDKTEELDFNGNDYIQRHYTPWFKRTKTKRPHHKPMNEGKLPPEIPLDNKEDWSKKRWAMGNYGKETG